MCRTFKSKFWFASCSKIVIPIMVFALLGTIGGGTTMAETGEMAGATNASEVWRALQRLQKTATVLHTVAHPDDENGALLTWLSQAGGQNRAILHHTRRRWRKSHSDRNCSTHSVLSVPRNTLLPSAITVWTSFLPVPSISAIPSGLMKR